MQRSSASHQVFLVVKFPKNLKFVLDYTGWNLYGSRTKLLYQLEHKLDFGQEPIVNRNLK